MANQSNSFHGTNVLGGFSVQGNQFNGPVNIGGSSRDDTDGLQFLRLLKAVNPEYERRRILTVKDQLVKASYSWLLEDETFRSWRNGDTNNLLWIKGGPGKGKTMMMAGLVDVLSEARTSGSAIALSYFFCQNSDTELRKATSIVKGLIYMLAIRERDLLHHLKAKYEVDGEKVFTGPRALFTLWHVLEIMLRDFHGARVYLIVDGLDECDDPEFNYFWSLLSGCNVTTPGKVKWLVTSRPLPRIEESIEVDQGWCMINLEGEAQHVSRGVETFINEKLRHLRRKKHWSPQTVERVQSYLQKNAEGTFLWVALVCQRLQRLPEWDVENEITNIANIQRGLDPFYDRMLQVAREEIPQYADWCMKILRATTLVYRPLRLQELATVVALPHRLQNADSPDFAALRDLIERCGSFILVHEDTIYFVHQSAKDYLSAGNNSTNFPLDRLQEHTLIAERCLDTLNSCLKDHQFPHPTSLSKQSSGEDDLRLLSKIAYACSYWIHHTLESVSQTSFQDTFPNEGKIHNLLDSRLIAWVHALGSLKEVTGCVRMIKALLDTQSFESTRLFHMTEETWRFLRQNRHIVEESPNQAYTSALLFVPNSSWIREKYQNQIPQWVRLRTRLNDTWDACLETLLGHSGAVTSLTFSSDGRLLASKSEDCTTRLWETETGKCLGMISHNSPCGYLAFSPHDRVLLSESEKGLQLLDTTTGSQKHIPVGKNPQVRFGSQIIASRGNGSIQLWNMFTGESRRVSEIHGRSIFDFDLSHDGKRIVIAVKSDVEIWDLETSKLVATLRGHCSIVFHVQFSPDSRFVFSACPKSIWLWPQATTKPGKKLEGPPYMVETAELSPDGSLILSTYNTGTILILWETSTGNQLHLFILESPFWDDPVFSPDSRTLVATLAEGAISWDTTTGEKIASIDAVDDFYLELSDTPKCSKDGNIFAQVIGTETLIWEMATGDILDIFRGHSQSISALEFSPTGGLIASASYDHTVKLWSLDKTTLGQGTLRTEIGAIQLITLSLDDTLTAFMSASKGPCLCDLGSGSPRILLGPDEYHLGLGSRDLVISPDKSLLAWCTDSDLWIRDTGKGSFRYHSSSFHDFIRRIAFSPDSNLLKIELRDGSIRLVENRTPTSKDVWKPVHADTTQSQISPDGRFVVRLDPSLRSTCLWEQQKDADQMIFKFELGEAEGAATFSPDSKSIAFVSSAGFISVWETETGACHNVSSNCISCTSVVAFSHDNRFIIHTSGHQHNLCLLELSTGISRALTIVGAEPVKLVAFSPDASIVAVVSDSTIVLWKTPSGSPAGKLEYGLERVSDITFLPDRNILIAGHEHGTIRSWDTNSCALLHTLRTNDFTPRFSLDSERKFLWTGNAGYFFDECLQPHKKPSISLKDDWVLFNGERVFWLPTEFRPVGGSSWFASSKRLVIGHPLAHLTLVDFDI